jgi:ABC-type multidrug transport system ATPase subunit
MKVTLKNLGLFKQAEFTLGDLTIICGNNNTGKTYATYALFGFLYFWKDLVQIGMDDIEIDLDIDDSTIEKLISNSTIRIDLRKIPLKRFDVIVDKACVKYTSNLFSKVFAASVDRFRQSEFKINLNDSEDKIVLGSSPLNLNYGIDSEQGEVLKIDLSRKHESEIILTLKAGNSNVKVDFKNFKSIIKIIVIDAVRNEALSELFPNPFIISSERTGAATFRKELDFARNRMLKTIAHGNRDIDTITSVLQRGYQDYPLPVEENLEFTRNLERIVKQRSFIADRYPEILDEFADMIGGDYQVSGEDILSYVPRKHKKLKLSLTESSSAIRSLLDLGFYLRHQAAVGDLLIIDEPELNLHPENQRRIARLLARLVNLGIKVLITTHSDYIIKELNTLIMLDRDEPHLKQIAEEENYLASELLSPDKVKVYIAKEALVQLEGQKKKTRSPTLVPAKITPELGIELDSFDMTIDTINRIQERIVWGSD